MVLDLDSPDKDYRDNRLLENALNAQLAMLDGFFPAHGWLIIDDVKGVFKVVGTFGAWRSKGGPDAVSDFMSGNWTANADHPGFQYRELDQVEKLRLNGLLPDTVAPDCMIRHPLRNPEGTVQAWLVGVVNQKTIGAIMEPRFPVEYVTHAVLGITFSLSLNAELTAVRHKLAELKRNAFIEPLTQVLNRAGWMHRLDDLEAIVARSNEDVAIVMLDLDLLKLVNDVEGHSAGDQLLQLTAQTIQSVTRRSDVVGRLGGDEFGVAVRGVDPVLAQSMVKRLRTALDNVGVDVSMGLAMNSETGNLAEALMLADRRMYEQKRSKPMPQRAMNWQRDSINNDLQGQSTQP